MLGSDDDKNLVFLRLKYMVPGLVCQATPAPCEEFFLTTKAISPVLQSQKNDFLSLHSHEIAGSMIKRVRDERMRDGMHIMAFGKEVMVPDIMAATGL